MIRSVEALPVVVISPYPVGLLDWPVSNHWMDLVLSNCRIIDGTGAPWFRGWIGIEDGTISQVGRKEPPTGSTIDIGDNMVCPGFIDAHSHSDLRLFTEPELAPKTRQGVTTEILGQDGFSMAPMYRDGGAQQWEDHLKAIGGRAQREWTWGGIDGYLDAVEKNGVATNVATLVGHGTVRFNVMGMDDSEPTADQLSEMADLVTEALDDGAIGFSTGLIYPPQVNASTAEVRELASRLEPFGRPFVAHIRDEMSDIWGALEEFIRIGETESIPLHLSHFKLALPPQHGKARRAIEILDAARERGVDITADQYPYTASATVLTEVLPDWIHADGPEAALDYLQNDTDRARIYTHIDDRPESWENVDITSVATDENAHVVGKTIAEVADERGVDPAVAIMDLLVEESLEVSKVTHMLHEDDVREILAFDHACIATDGLFGGKPHPRTYGTFPRVLGKYVRTENHLRIEDAVRMMTALPACAMGLDHKGVIRTGMDADLTVFEPATVDSNATYESPRNHPDGIVHVLVDGTFVVRDGTTTGSLPGQAIRAR